MKVGKIKEKIKLTFLSITEMFFKMKNRNKWILFFIGFYIFRQLWLLFILIWFICWLICILGYDRTKDFWKVMTKDEEEVMKLDKSNDGPYDFSSKKCDLLKTRFIPILPISHETLERLDFVKRKAPIIPINKNINKKMQ